MGLNKIDTEMVRFGYELFFLTINYYTLFQGRCNVGGNGEIRTHDTLLYACFQDRCLQPLGHISNNPYYNTKISEIKDVYKHLLFL